MKSRVKCSGIAKLCLISALMTPVFVMTATPQSNTSPDNTAVNKQDRKTSEPTADQGKNGNSDRETMRKIRRAVVSDKSLSTYAHNVKIIAQNGKVTLKGPVNTEEEKKTVEEKATEIAGSGNVTDEMTVKGESK